MSESVTSLASLPVSGVKRGREDGSRSDGVWTPEPLTPPRLKSSSLRGRSGGVRVQAGSVTSRARRLSEASRVTLDALLDVRQPAIETFVPAPPAAPNDSPPQRTLPAETPTTTSPVTPPVRAAETSVSRAAARQRLAAVKAAAQAGVLEPPGLHALFESVRAVFITGDGAGRHMLPLTSVAEAVRRAAGVKSHASDGEGRSRARCAPRLLSRCPASSSATAQSSPLPLPWQRPSSATSRSCRARHRAGCSCASSPRRGARSCASLTGHPRLRRPLAQPCRPTDDEAWLCSLKLFRGKATLYTESVTRHSFVVSPTESDQFCMTSEGTQAWGSES